MMNGKVRGQCGKKSVYSPPDDRTKSYPSVEILAMGATYRASCTEQQQQQLSEGSAYDWDVKILIKKDVVKFELVTATPISK